jgi:hypothetical protein
MKRSKKWWSVKAIISSFMVLSLIACGGSGGDENGGSNETYPPSYTTGKIIFVTHTAYKGDLSSWMTQCSSLSGLQAADCICQQHAQIWGNLSGTYKAWLSDSTTSASSRLSHSSGPYVNRRGDFIAANWAALATLQCTDVTNYDESGEFMSLQFDLVWTGSDSSGNILAPPRHCNNWTSGSPSVGGWVGCSSADTGYPNFNGCWSEWVDGNGWRDCDGWNRLYCVEQ